VVGILAAGCSSSSPGSGATTAAAGVAATSSTSAPAGGYYHASKPSTSAAATVGTPVAATEQEFSIALSTKTFAAGAYTFTVHNAGKYPHNLTIEGPGVDKVASPTEPGGGTGTVSVTLQKGSYELWCSVDSHKDKGMDLTITVT
jgi:uncharacterized cupredoxin-like copper-binding protein